MRKICTQTSDYFTQYNSHLYALKEVIYVLALKITHYKCFVFFVFWLGKSYGNDGIYQAFDEYLGRSVIWGISVVFYCALLKKKRTRDKKKIVDWSWWRPVKSNSVEIYTWHVHVCLTDCIYVCICVRVYVFTYKRKTDKWIDNRSIAEYNFRLCTDRTWGDYISLFKRLDLKFPTRSSRLYKKKESLIRWFTLSLLFTSSLIFFSSDVLSRHWFWFLRWLILISFL